MRYTYSKSNDKYSYTCRRSRIIIYIEDLKIILIDVIKKQIKKINDVEVIEVKILKCFEDYTKGEIAGEKLKITIKEFTKEKNKLLLNLDKGFKQAKSVLSKISNCKIDDGLILKLIASSSVISTGKRKYNIHINYNFKNQIIGA